MHIEVIYALPEQAWRRWADVEPGATAAEVFAASGLVEIAGEKGVRLGVFGRKVDGDHVMQRGERVELYRPLLADPRQRRRRRSQCDS